jgi:CO/xanthine dehydrogenase Mo-binding subunit
VSAIGASVPRGGGYERVTGAQLFLADLRLPDALHAKLVTLDCARARVAAIDTSAAALVPGVRLIMTAADLPQPVPRFGPQFKDRPVLAAGETLYHGEPVAAVAAETEDAAIEAARLVRVEYEELPAVFTISGALAPDAPLVRDPALRPDDPLAGTNVLREHRFGWGDVDEAPADVVVEHTYTFPMVTHFAIEPHGCMAAPDGDGITCWSTIQHPYQLQKALAGILRLPLAKVHVLAPDLGGGFGGKQSPKFEPLVALMALAAGRPVRLVLTLEETFQAVRRAATEIRVRTGLLRDGSLAFQDIHSDYLIGAYADTADRIVAKSSYVACGPYRVPAARIVARTILSHTTPSCAMRGIGTPQVNWAVESNLDEAARQLGIDGLTIRLSNLAAHGDQFIPGDTPADGDWPQVVRRAAQLIGWAGQPPQGHGRGIACGLKAGPTSGLSYATVRMLADGSVLVYAGTSEMGQGARTVFAQIAAQELGVPLERVTVVMGDTNIVPFDLQTSASRSTVMMGTAVVRACQEIREQLRQLVAMAEGIDASSVAVENGAVRLLDRELPLADALTRGLGKLGGELTGNGEMRKEAEPDHPLGGTPAFYEFNCTAVEGRVDEATGETILTRYVTVTDVGKSLNPDHVRGQDEGSAVMGLGHALMEHYIFDDAGRIRNLGAIDYRIPTSLDLPVEMLSEVIENGDGPGPYGAKGIGEGAALCVAPAVAAAVCDATGAIIRDLPLTPERVWTALQAAKQTSGLATDLSPHDARDDGPAPLVPAGEEYSR